MGAVGSVATHAARAAAAARDDGWPYLVSYEFCTTFAGAAVGVVAPVRARVPVAGRPAGGSGRARPPGEVTVTATASLSTAAQWHCACASALHDEAGRAPRAAAEYIQVTLIITAKLVRRGDGEGQIL
jgi:hypothetical protein